MSLGEICNREVIIIDPQSSIRDAARLMRDYHVGDVVVVEEKGGMRVPVGILTDRDIVIELLARDVDPDTVSVGDVMSQELLTAREDDGQLEAVKSMREMGVRRLPVISREGGLVGIVTLDDLIDLAAEQLTDLVRLVSNEQARERRTRV